MSATNFCGSPHSGGMGMMPRRNRYVPASAGGADARRMLGGKWDLEQNTGTALDAAGRIWRQTFSFRPDREKPKTYLVFENLEQSLRVWLNGTYLGCGAAATVKVRASFAGSLQPVSVRILDRAGTVTAQAAGSGELTLKTENS